MPPPMQGLVNQDKPVPIPCVGARQRTTSDAVSTGWTDGDRERRCAASPTLAQPPGAKGASLLQCGNGQDDAGGSWGGR